MPFFQCNAADHSTIRHPAVADQFYSGNRNKLEREVNQYLKTKSPLSEYPPIIISPHAGYVFSGPLAGIGFSTINKQTNKVILIGPSHKKYFTGISIPEVVAYKTPLGDVPLHQQDIKKLRTEKNVHAYPDAHAEEHCLEVQLPFLQLILRDFKIIPIITGNIGKPQDIANMIHPLIDKNTLVVISSDFSHFHSHTEAKAIDKRSVATILAEDKDGFIDGCGETPIRIGMCLAQIMGLKPKLLDARNSYETAPQYGSEDRVVGYASIVYVSDKPEGTNSNDAKIHEAEEGKKESDQISVTDQNFMLLLARDALTKAVKGEKPPRPESIPARAQEVSGCFVTLTKKGSLRGCIGYIEGIKPLYQAIIDNAKNAALGDPRFPNVTAKELDNIKIEVSILTKPEPIIYNNANDLLKQIVPYEDGIILKKGYRQSTYLPQVWDQLPEKISFLEHLAQKAGLNKNDWKKAEYKKYQAIHFEEK